jgi:ribosomal protein L7/L12
MYPDIMDLARALSDMRSVHESIRAQFARALSDMSNMHESARAQFARALDRGDYAAVVARGVHQLNPELKIQGIKLVRVALDCGLKEARDLWELAAWYDAGLPK